MALAGQTLKLPIMLGESTPRGYGVQDKPWSLFKIAPSTDSVDAAAGGGGGGGGADANGGMGSSDTVGGELCIGVSDASTTDGAALELWSCGPGPNQLWRFTEEEGYLVNKDGKCVGVSAASPSVPITTECGGMDSGPLAGRWMLDQGMIVSVPTTNSNDGDRRCLIVPTAARGTALQIGLGQACSAPSSAATPTAAITTLGRALLYKKPLQQWVEVPTQVGGGNATWRNWFAPYIALIRNNPAVKAFCYIDWFWPQYSSKVKHPGFNWYNWGDDRVEQSTIVGDKWKAALGSSQNWAINAQPTKKALCKILGCPFLANLEVNNSSAPAAAAAAAATVSFAERASGESPECEAQLMQLSTIYGKLNGDDWTNQGNWVETTAECGCDWWGVYCEGAVSGQNVTNLQLSYNDCSGILPDMELVRLPYLARVALNGNDIGGTIPDEMGQLWNLEQLDLSWNRLTGTIPPKLGQLVLLTQLLLYHNQLTGPLPGTLGNLTKLEHFYADRNQLSGTIPATFGGMHAMMELSLFDNAFTAVPGTLSQTKNLTTLALQQNNITGPLDPRLEALAQQVDAHKPATGGCMLAGNPLTCPVPSWAIKLCHAACIKNAGSS